MKFIDLFNKRHTYGDDDKKVIESLHLEGLALESLESMKQTDGWKLIDLKLREEIRKCIVEKVKDDVKIQLIIQLLTTAETKNARTILEEEIDKIVPQD